MWQIYRQARLALNFTLRRLHILVFQMTLKIIFSQTLNKGRLLEIGVAHQWYVWFCFWVKLRVLCFSYVGAVPGIDSTRNSQFSLKCFLISFYSSSNGLVLIKVRDHWPEVGLTVFQKHYLVLVWVIYNKIIILLLHCFCMAIMCCLCEIALSSSLTCSVLAFFFVSLSAKRDWFLEAALTKLFESSILSIIPFSGFLLLKRTALVASTLCSFICEDCKPPIVISFSSKNLTSLTSIHKLLEMLVVQFRCDANLTSASQPTSKFGLKLCALIVERCMLQANWLEKKGVSSRIFLDLFQFLSGLPSKYYLLIYIVLQLIAALSPGSFSINISCCVDKTGNAFMLKLLDTWADIIIE